MSGKLSIFRTARSHITKIDDLEAIEVLVKLASGLCFTFMGVGSNPTWVTRVLGYHYISLTYRTLDILIVVHKEFIRH